MLEIEIIYVYTNTALFEQTSNRRFIREQRGCLIAALLLATSLNRSDRLTDVYCLCIREKF